MIPSTTWLVTKKFSVLPSAHLARVADMKVLERKDVDSYQHLAVCQQNMHPFFHFDWVSVSESTQG